MGEASEVAVLVEVVPVAQVEEEAELEEDWRASLFHRRGTLRGAVLRRRRGRRARSGVRGQLV